MLTTWLRAAARAMTAKNTKKKTEQYYSWFGTNFLLSGSILLLLVFGNRRRLVWFGDLTIYPERVGTTPEYKLNFCASE
jgi:hypothetical protein